MLFFILFDKFVIDSIITRCAETRINDNINIINIASLLDVDEFCFFSFLLYVSISNIIEKNNVINIRIIVTIRTTLFF